MVLEKFGIRFYDVEMSGEEKELSFERGLVEMYRKLGDGYLKDTGLVLHGMRVRSPRIANEAAGKPEEASAVKVQPVEEKKLA